MNIKEKDEDGSAEEEIVIVDDPQEEVETSGDIDSSRDEETEKKEKKSRRGGDGNQKRGNDAQKRLNTLWQKKKEEQQQKEAALRDLAAERTRSAEMTKITSSALEDSLNAKKELLTERLVRAQESEDHKKVAEITGEMSKVEAQSARLEQYKMENQINSKTDTPNARHSQNTREEATPTPDEVYENMSPAGKAWLDSNRDWFDQEGEGYDAEKAADVVYYAGLLEREGRFPIGTRAYFKQIDTYIKENWEEGEEDVSEDPKPTPKPGFKQTTQSAPVSRGGSGKPSGGGKQYKLTQSEKEMALSMDAYDKSGRSLSETDKIKKFIGLKETTPGSGPISMKTIRRSN